MIEAVLESRTFRIEKKKGILYIDDEATEPDIHRQGERLWHVIHNSHSYTVFVHKVDRDRREVALSVNGKKATVRLDSRIHKLLKALGMDETMQKKISELRAPMPGLIHSVKVVEGSHVQKGDPILILEAMKMENVIKAEGEGIVSKIHVVEKASVEKNTLLVSFA
ncbi:MAG: acetyl-CoA carboxylase biotin carboxyl carrier protein subunit [Bacteroidia bacterium]